MAKKTVQALKISATVSIGTDGMANIEQALLHGGSGQAMKAASAKVRFTHAIVARYDEPAYQARVTQRIAAIKGHMDELGAIEAWHVTAGAVAVDEAEVLGDE